MADSTRGRIIAEMRRNWRDEVEGARTYRDLAAREPDAHRRDILIRLAEAEERHATLWEQHLRDLGAEAPDRAAVPSRLAGGGAERDQAAWLRQLEADEARDAEKYRRLLGLLPAGPVRQAVESMATDELGHADRLGALNRPGAGSGEQGPPGSAGPGTGGAGAALAAPDKAARAPDRINPRAALEGILARERWHVTGTAGWIGDAIYGANDGLGAIFGIVAGVAGYTGGGSHLVVVSGLAGMMASALSMGSGAYLASKSEGEVHEAEIERERQELVEAPEEEMEELQLFYQLKGLSEAEAKDVVRRLSRQPDVMLRSLVQEELGLNAEAKPNPVRAAVSSSVATAIGAIIPVIPFFFLHGTPAILVAAGVSLAAHFVVGALKTIVTSRSWAASGLEMTIVGAIEGAITYGLGVLLAGM